MSYLWLAASNIETTTTTSEMASKWQVIVFALSLRLICIHKSLAGLAGVAPNWLLCPVDRLEYANKSLVQLLTLFLYHEMAQKGLTMVAHTIFRPRANRPTGEANICRHAALHCNRNHISAHLSASSSRLEQY